MDTMALLCNLYGNGPATLRRLRDSGCTTLEGLERIDVDRLAELLTDSPDAARRFLREARRLSARVLVGATASPSAPGGATTLAESDDYDEEFEGGDDDYDDEDYEDDEDDEDEDEDDEDEDEDEDDAYGDEEYEEEDAYAEERAPRAPGGRAAPARATERRLKERALEVWRKQDRERRAGPPTVHAAAPGEAAKSPLQPDMLEGLDAACVGSLATRGVDSLESLAAADVDALAPATGVRLTRLLRLRYLARNALSRGSAIPRSRLQTTPLSRLVSAPAVRATLRAQRAPATLQPEPGPGSAAALARTAVPTVRFSPAERPEENRGRLEEALAAAPTVHRAPSTFALRGEPAEPAESAGPFA